MTGCSVWKSISPPPAPETPVNPPATIARAGPSPAIPRSGGQPRARDRGGEWLSRAIGWQVLLIAAALLGRATVAPGPAPAEAAPDSLIPIAEFSPSPAEVNPPTDATSEDGPASAGNTGETTPVAPSQAALPEPVEPLADLTLPDTTPVEIPDLLPAPALAMSTAPAVREPATRARPPAPVAGSNGPAKSNAGPPTTAARPNAGVNTTGSPSLFTGGGSGRFPLPPYPAEAKRRGLEGRVMLRVAVGPDGKPGTPSIESGSGHAVLDRAAIDWIQRRWRWDAGAARLFRIPVIFQLQ